MAIDKKSLLLGFIVSMLIYLPAFLYIRNYYFSTTIKKISFFPTVSPTYIIDIPTVTTIPRKSPIKAVFMRQGEIWIKDIPTNEEKKISKTKEVFYPFISSSGNYVIYSDVEKGWGGMPRGALYLLDLNEDKEEKMGIINQTVSQITWSETNDFLGFIIVPDAEYALTEVIVYDAQIKKVINRNTISLMEYDQNGQRTIRDWTKAYNVNLNCHHMESKYINFCEEYQLKLNTPRSIEFLNNLREKYRNSNFLNNKDYSIANQGLLENGLLILEYYKKDINVTDSKSGIDAFIPGYSPGFTETYSLLIDKDTEKILFKIPNAMYSDFLFK